MLLQSWRTAARSMALISMVALFVNRDHYYESSSTPRRQLRAAITSQGAPRQEKEHYQGNALTFIITYGVYYHLFDLFFASEHESKPRISQRTDHLNVTEVRSKPLSDNFEIRSYAYAKSYGIATAEVNPEYMYLNFTYTRKPKGEEMNAYNNKFRYGPNVDDRFMSIAFNKDPVDEATQAAPAYIYFIGVTNELPEGFGYICYFSEHNKESPVEITRHLRNAVHVVTANTIVRCPVPWSVSSALRQEQDVERVVVDLVRISEVEGSETLLGNIHVPRLHPLDRRSFKYVVNTMLDDLKDPMVVEWLIHNIMLGVEHFYLFYNAQHADLALEHSQLKPFLDANLITIIFFPFAHHVHFNQVQIAALNTYLYQFGGYTQYAGLQDIDEFFVPTASRLPYLNNQTYSMPLLDSIVPPIAADPRCPAVTFNMLDMDCRPEDGPGALHRGVTTRCNRTGFLYEEFHHSHGKMFIRPALVTHLASPHRVDQYHIQYTDDWQGGTFRHFNGFRYTHEAIKIGQFSESKIATEDKLRNFTLTTLRELVGITLQE